MAADGRVARTGRRESGHAEPNACHQGLDCKRISDPKGQQTARPSGSYKLSQAEHRLINSTCASPMKIHARWNTSERRFGFKKIDARQTTLSSGQSVTARHRLPDTMKSRCSPLPDHESSGEPEY
jgi:hypothetical protein